MRKALVDRRAPTPSPATLGRRTRAYAVHAYTASGVALAFLAAAEICAPTPDARAVFLYLASAVLIDSTDGPLARRWQVKQWLPKIEGRTIDDIVDFLTYTFVPLLLMWRMEWLPPPAEVWVIPALMASYSVSRTVRPRTREGDVAVRQVDVDPVEIVGPERAARAPLARRGIEHEVVDDQLAAMLEQLGQRLLPRGPSKTYDLVTFSHGSSRRCRLSSSRSRVNSFPGHKPRPHPISLNGVSKHVKVLERAGQVERTVQGREHRLRLNAEPLREASMWLEHYRTFWDTRLAALEALLLKKERGAGSEQAEHPREDGR
jgi:hypothetical protein